MFFLSVFFLILAYKAWQEPESTTVATVFFVAAVICLLKALSKASNKKASKARRIKREEHIKIDRSPWKQFSLTSYSSPSEIISPADIERKQKEFEKRKREAENRRRSRVCTSSTIEDELSRVDKMDGHSFEYWCADLLQKHGYNNVHVTPGSGDQGVDILCEKKGIKYAVQCKCYHKDLGNTPVQQIIAGTIFYRCDQGIVMTNQGFTPGANELAKSTDVILWGRDDLIDMLDYMRQAEPKNECVYCGNMLSSSANYCDRCGNAVHVQEIDSINMQDSLRQAESNSKCAFCDALLASNVNYCAKCGRPVSIQKKGR